MILQKCVVRESNPGHLLGRQIYYHCTNDAAVPSSNPHLHNEARLESIFDVTCHKIHPPRIELGTFRVLGERHNQLDQGCLYLLRSNLGATAENIQTFVEASQNYNLRGLNPGPVACEATVITN